MRCRLWFLNLLLGVLVLALTVEPGRAQTGATISGRVQDASGAAVSDVTVTVRSLETGATRVATTDETGNFRTLALSVGRHEVRAERPGFRVAVRSGINLEVGQEAVVNFQLEVGELIQEEIRVVAEVPIINATTSEISGLV